MIVSALISRYLLPAIKTSDKKIMLNVARGIASIKGCSEHARTFVWIMTTIVASVPHVSSFLALRGLTDSQPHPSFWILEFDERKVLQALASAAAKTLTQYLLRLTPYDMMRSSHDFEDVKAALNERTTWTIEVLRSVFA
ncbi:hypothetical protein PAXINDRAFT_103946 [Paxillus involutus ATCC 200175]|uniref:Uncharacterized protein n=1 Tax=Paxillus involutus ATCC 200175 TaxID=664439 RepID=A0A0C9T9U8_PAXIN|nr:hypothetical protein PAXINDRAFT_103946 [Paxillus involutus ATCC 200175]